MNIHKRHFGILFFLLVLASPMTYGQCHHSLTTMQFNTYLHNAPEGSFSNAEIRLECSELTNVGLSFSTGNSGNYQNRHMVFQQETLQYNLYQNASLTQVLGDGTNGSHNITITIAPNSTIDLSIYGYIPPRQNLMPGLYQDNISVTLTY